MFRIVLPRAVACSIRGAAGRLRSLGDIKQWGASRFMATS
jgi:hypothetical protein